MIKIKELSVSYSDTINALNKIDLTIANGEKIAILGPSGCGKSTLLCSIAGLIEPNKGTIAINDQIITSVRKKTALIFQGLGLFPWKTVMENISFPLLSRNTTKTVAESHAYEIMNRLDITECAERYPSEISGGQKQRTAIARALALDSDILLMDEASSALDLTTKLNICKLIDRLQQEKKFTLIFVTHDPQEAVWLADRILIMKSGSIIHTLQNQPMIEATNNEESFYRTYNQIVKLMSNGENE